MNSMTYLEQTVDMEFSRGSGQTNVDKQRLVLAVDDNEDNLMLITFVLELFGCSFISAADGQTALALIQDYHPDLILLDIMLPDLDGIEFVSRLRQNPRTSMIPVIAVTAMARAEDRDRILSAGCNDYISKPYIVDDLEAMLRRYLI